MALRGRGAGRRLLGLARAARLRLDPGQPRYRPPVVTVPGSHLRIAVVGAGIAGLAAAWQLERLGHTVQVFEARSRPGGRIYTESLGPFSVEVGAARFSDRHYRALHWIARLGLSLEPMYPSSGRLVRLTESERQVGRDTALLSNHDIHNGVSHPDSWNDQPGSRMRLARRLLVTSLRDPTWFRIKGGNAQLPGGIARDLKNPVMHDSSVQRVSQLAAGVEIGYTRDGVRHARSFDRCVLATPISNQSRIQFDPPLSEAKQSYSRALRQQPAIRSFALIRDRRSLEREQLNGFGCTSSGFEIWQPSFLSSPTASMVLALYGQGDASRLLEPLDSSGRTQYTMNLLARLFPGVEDDVVHTTSYSWAEDPWAGGAQTLVDSHDQSVRASLGKPEGLLHFAGEHTRGGWIDDALESADRVVREISGVDRASTHGSRRQHVGAAPPTEKRSGSLGDAHQ